MPSKSNNIGFTPDALQGLLKEKLEKIFEPVVLFSSDGADRKMKVYSQDLPKPKGSDEDDGSDTPPYAIVRMTGGSRNDPEEPMEVDFYVILCIFDMDPNREGHRTLLNAISRIENWFGESSTLGPFDIMPGFDFVLQDADTHPYYYGAVKLSFGVPKTTKRSDYA